MKLRVLKLKVKGITAKKVWKSIKQKIASVKAPRMLRNFVIIAIFAVLGAGWFLYRDVYMTPEKRFWIAINNSMATPSVVRTTTQGGSGNKVVQDYRFYYNPQRAIQNRVSYAVKNATTDARVETEGVITPTAQYLRYSNFYNKTADKKKATSLGELIDQWASGGEGSPSKENSALNYQSEQVGLAIFGNFGPNFRKQIIDGMKKDKVYGNRLSNPVKDVIKGQKVYIYRISVNLRDYVGFAQKAFVEAGYPKFAPLNPDNYRKGSTVDGTILVNQSTNVIVGISFGRRTEVYNNYGIIKKIVEPKSKMTIPELQKKVQDKVQLPR